MGVQTTRKFANMDDLLRKFNQPSTLVNRRKFHNLRSLVDEATPLLKATLMWEARKIGPGNLADLEANIVHGDMKHASESVPYPHIKKALHYATPPQKSAILWMAAKLEPDDLVELDGYIQRSALFRSKSAPGQKQHETRP